MKNQKLPVGIENFELLRKENFYYIDKTGLIRDLLNDWGSVNLFTRPRRCGRLRKKTIRQASGVMVLKISAPMR